MRGQRGLVLEETLENQGFFAEDVWKTRGRRAHLSCFGLEDVLLSKGNRNDYYFLLQICVFQGNTREVSTSSTCLPDVFRKQTATLFKDGTPLTPIKVASYQP